MKTLLSATYGTHSPSLSILRETGYAVKLVCYRKRAGSVTCHFIAEKGDVYIAGESGAEALGLAVMWEKFGAKWNDQTPDVMDEVLTEEPDPDEAP